MSSSNRKTGRRVAVVGVLQETNTFVEGETGWERFENGILLQGKEIVEQYGAGNHEISGFLSGLCEAGIKPVPILFAFALPGPRVSADALDRLWSLIDRGLHEAGPLDGCLVAIGGAAVATDREDVEGWLLSQLRSALGKEMPIIATMDPHGHVSRAMLAATNALLAYRTNPHLDQKERGEKAARLMALTLEGRAVPKQRFCRLPLVINIQKQSTDRPPLSRLYDRCRLEEKRPGIFDTSIVLGFPYGDVPEMGSGVLVVSDQETPEADTVAPELGKALWEQRRELAGELLSPLAAVARAAISKPPVLMLDMGDNVGGGACGDGTRLAHELIGRSELKSFVCLYDPEAVKACRAAGTGARFSLQVGGWSNRSLQGAPLELEASVVSFPPATFHEDQPRHGGWREFSLGDNGLVRSREGNLTVLITSNRVAPFSAGLLSVAGLRPEDFDVIVAKGVHGPLGAFGAACRTVIWVDTPGVSSANLARLPYLHRRRPMEPFEEIDQPDWNDAVEKA